MSNIDGYFKLQEEIEADFGYEGGWRVYPLDDMREVYWSIQGGTVWWSDEQSHHQQLIEQNYEYDGIPDDDVYSGEMRNDVILVSKDEEQKHTLILVDTHTDGNVFLMIFDNAKQIPAKRKEK